ncbi:hypothetical protein WA026_004122 [Henosepilachna vigintioctopunctata]|uniref:Uncharacterized protein n=1 Tax=Henosepilachna vigintioctopunctata TaxID=420089 RepID=A0AAW1UFJ9_9CUCU
MSEPCSCLSYGHSCWGAHGKRSGYIGNPKYLDSSRLLMRLMQQNANHRSEMDKEVMRDYENVPSRAEVQQLINDVEMESNPMKTLSDYEADSDVLFDDNVPVFEGITENHLKPSITRRISQRILKKRSTKMN